MYGWFTALYTSVGIYEDEIPYIYIYSSIAKLGCLHSMNIDALHIVHEWNGGTTVFASRKYIGTSTHFVGFQG